MNKMVMIQLLITFSANFNPITENEQIDIQANIDNPQQLEKLYRENRGVFKTEFSSLIA
jgi:hypothetical protein